MKRFFTLALLLVVSFGALADTKISQFPPASTLGGSEQLAGVQGGINVAVTPQQIAAFSVGIIQATASGTNAIALTTTKQSISGYVNLQLFSFLAANTSTGAVTVQVGAFAALPLYNPSGIQAAAGDIVQSSTYVVSYNSTLNGNAGGFIVINASPTAANATPPGIVAPFAGASAPNGWLFANGQAVSRTTFSALFSAVGTTYGIGDGSTTFNLPDMRGRSPFGIDSMGAAGPAGVLGSNTSAGGCTGTVILGQKCGAQTHTPILAEMFQHNHTASSSFSGTVGADPTWSTGTNTSAALGGPDQVGPTTTIGVSGSVSTTVNNAGSSTPFNITPPALVLNYIIKTSTKRIIPANQNWPLARAI